MHTMTIANKLSYIECRTIWSWCIHWHTCHMLNFLIMKDHKIKTSDLLYYLFLFHQSFIFELLSLDLVLDEFLILGTFNLSACFAQLTLIVDLLHKVLSQVLLLKFLGVKCLLHLVKGLLWTEVRLVVKTFDDFFAIFYSFFFCNLISNVVAVIKLLLHAFRIFKSLHTIHVVENWIELLLFCFSELLDLVDIFFEAC